MNKYPDYITKYRPKGSIVKKVNQTYYVYKATSKRIPGKKYPVQVIKELLGKIDENGFHVLNNTFVNTEHVIIRECGFTNYFLLLQDYFIKDKNAQTKKKDKLIIFYSLIVYLSSNSYLIDNKRIPIYTIEELESIYNISLPKQLNALKKITELESLSILEPLKYVCRVYMGNKEFKSDLSQTQKELVMRLGVNENEIR